MKVAVITLILLLGMSYPVLANEIRQGDATIGMSGIQPSVVTIGFGVSSLIAIGSIRNLLRGDINGDGRVNAIDITSLERMIAGLDRQLPSGDVNRDGQINVLDITSIERAIAGY